MVDGPDCWPPLATTLGVERRCVSFWGAQWSLVAQTRLNSVGSMSPPDPHLLASRSTGVVLCRQHRGNSRVPRPSLTK